MESSPLSKLPQEIRDIIYTHLLVGLGSTQHENKTCNILDFFPPPTLLLRPSSPTSRHFRQRNSTSDILSVVAEHHSLLSTCQQLNFEGLPIFLKTNSFVLDINVAGLTSTCCKLFSSFVKGLGPRLADVRSLSLRVPGNWDAKSGISNPQLQEMITQLLSLKKKHAFRAGALKLQIRCFRDKMLGTASASHDSEIVFDVFVGDPGLSWRRFEMLKLRDTCEFERKIMEMKEMYVQLRKLRFDAEGSEWFWERLYEGDEVGMLMVMRRKAWEEGWCKFEKGVGEVIGLMQEGN